MGFSQHHIAAAFRLRSPGTIASPEHPKNETTEVSFQKTYVLQQRAPCPCLLLAVWTLSEIACARRAHRVSG